jgi:hypothetical protein
VKTPAPQRAAGRRALKAKGQTLPGTTSFPTPNVAYWHKALRSVGRVPAGKRPALASYLKKRAKQLGIPGHVKGTWLEKSPAAAMANDTEAVELAMTARRMPLIRGAADIQMARSAPGTVTVRHKSSGMHIGTLKAVDNDGQWMATHAPTGAKMPKAASMQGALSSLIAHHNRKAKLPPAQQDGTASYSGAGIASVKGYANGEQQALDFAGALPVSSPASSSSDGPRVTTMGAGKKVAGKAPVKLSAKLNLDPAAATIYARLRKRGMKHGQALAMCRRAAAMHAKAA